MCKAICRRLRRYKRIRLQESGKKWRNQIKLEMERNTRSNDPFIKE
jgi:hypothetical protein